jgi:signal transduction histidine kinase
MTSILRSTAVRLAVIYAVLFVLSAFCLVGFLWWRTAGYLSREVDAVILADTKAIGDRIQDFGLAGAIETINQRVGRSSDEHAIYLLADPALTPVAGNIDAWPAGIGPRQGWYQIPLVYQGRDHATRILYVVLPSGFRLLVGRDVQDREAIRGSILAGLGWAAAAAALLAIGGGLLVRRAIFRRVDAIDRTTSAIIHGDLGSRLPTQGSSDEFDRLTQTINGMLQQIQILVDGVRNASNAVAHDLRTPLAELRGRLEAILRARQPADLALHEIGEAVADLDRVIGVFNALLRLAEIESGARLSGFRDVRLSDVAVDVAELYGPLAEQRALTFSLDAPPDMGLRGDPILLAQAIGNLVDNAIKYCPAQGTVTLRLTRGGDGGIDVTVRDTGPGIADAEKPLATERFFRGTTSRGIPGVGLGLSVVAAVARLHGGGFTLADGNPGVIARLSFPASAGRPVDREGKQTADSGRSGHGVRVHAGPDGGIPPTCA